MNPYGPQPDDLSDVIVNDRDESNHIGSSAGTFGTFGTAGSVGTIGGTFGTAGTMGTCGTLGGKVRSKRQPFKS